jgi:1,4-alpha-glucan branching enzyme
MLTKQRTGGTSRKVKVSFTLTAPDAETVNLLGDFNDWQPKNVMTRSDDGTWGLTLTLDPEREYQFRYLVNGTSWRNDAAPDKYVPSPYGEDNCVVVT